MHAVVVLVPGAKGTAGQTRNYNTFLLPVFNGKLLVCSHGNNTVTVVDTTKI